MFAPLGTKKPSEMIRAKEFHYCEKFLTNSKYNRGEDYGLLTFKDPIERDNYFKILPPKWSQLIECIEINMCGYPSSKMKDQNDYSLHRTFG